jgi:putative tricarboxylic transport membrane protein
MRLLPGLLALVPALVFAQTTTTGWKPEKPVELIVGAAPGGANDRVGRSLQRMLQARHFVPSGMAVVNKPGGGQAIAFAYLNTHIGNPHYLALASSSWLTTVAAGRGSVTHRDVTPILKLLDEYQCYFVKADSPITSARDIVARLRQSPTSLSFGFSTAAGNPLHISIANIARQAGADPARIKAVVFNSGTDTAAQVAGGHLDVGVQSPGSALQLAHAGKVKIIAVAAPQRLTGELANIPTLREQGIDAIADVFYTVFAPKGIEPAQAAYWSEALATVMKSEELKKDLDINYWTVELVGPRELPAFLQREYENYRRALTEIGMVK